MLNKEHALALLGGFRAEYTFADTPPSDVIELAKCLGWEDVGQEIEGSIIMWKGEHLMSGFLDKWELDREVSKEAGKVISHEHLKKVGLAIKYEFVWQIISSILFLRSNLPKELLLESANDLECSILLSKERYFKQAFQVLRNYCEICVSTIYFQRVRNSYKKWLHDENGWHFPDYSEMLKGLTEYLGDKETHYLKSRYRKLNHSVHSKRRRLNMNIMRLERAARDYYIGDTLDWSEQFIGIARFIIELYIRKYLE